MAKKLIPTYIGTSRIKIRPISLDDAKAYFTAEQASLNELIPHWTWAKTDKSIEDIKQFICYAKECHNKDLPVEIYFSVLTQDNKFLGCIWLFDINWFVPNFEILYWLDTRELGKGYMSEAINALTRTCFQFYNAKRVQIKVSADNANSKSIPEKLAFKFEGEMENYFFDFSTETVKNGLLYSCCNEEDLPKIDKLEINK